ncbi:MAG: beta strand repeat-containing protein [Limisphaerales bacterium]
MTHSDQNATQRCILNLLLLFILLALPAHAVSTSFTQLYSLAGNCDAALVQSTNGLLFGTTLSGGPGGGGSIFAASPTTSRFSGSFTNLHSFATSDGGESHGGVAMAPSGMLYGTTARLAQSNNIFLSGMGSIYGMSQSGAFNVLYAFGTSTNELGQPLDGASPRAVPVVSGDTLYGTAFEGGSSGYDNNGLGYGVVFSIGTNGNSFSVLHSFSGSDGANPTILSMAKDGSLYGVTTFGGANVTVQTNGVAGFGTIFNITTNGIFTPLYSFGTLTNAAGNPLDGSQPNALFQARDGVYYGTAASGGSNGVGTFFSITTNGTFTLLYSFGSVTDTSGVAVDGANPNGALVQGADGNLYGVTLLGGATNAGTLYRMTPQGQLTTVYPFPRPLFLGQGTSLNPRGGLFRARDGYFYGTTDAGGGTVYKVGPGAPTVSTPIFGGVPVTNLAGSTITYSETVTSIYATDTHWSFNGTSLDDSDPGHISGAATSRLTISNLVVGDSGTYALVASNAAGFSGLTNRLVVIPALVTTQPLCTNVAAGATNVFTVSAESNLPFTCQWQFNGTNLTDDARFSGTSTTNLTLSGAMLSDSGSYSAIIANSAGSVTSSNAVLNVQPFLLIKPPTNQYAVAGLPASVSVGVQTFGAISYQWQFNGANLTDDGYISGSTTSNLLLQPASISNSGTYTVTISNAVGVTNLSALLIVFPQTAPNCVITNLYSFSYPSIWGPNQLQLGPDGLIYGVTEDGGAYGAGTGNGTFFRVETNGTFTTLHSFAGGNDGFFPNGQLALSPNGSFFGTVDTSGACCAVFNITTNGATAPIIVLTNLSYSRDITMGANGFLYGTDDDGNFFSVDPTSGIANKLYSFGPYAGVDYALTLGPDGLLYGTTTNEIFKMDNTGNLTHCYTFTNPADGAWPIAYFAWATNGDLYGVTSSGGAYGCGTIFKLSTDAQLTTLYSFGQKTNWDGTSVDGSYPLSLIWGPDGMLYGPTLYGGCNNRGTVFRISTDETFDTLAWFNSVTGWQPTFGKLVVGSDGNIYGTTSFGGAGSQGSVYRIDVVPNNDSLSATCDGTGAIVLTTPAVPGHVYQLQYTTSLSPLAWQNLTSGTATSNTLTFTDTPSDTQRFYRLLLLK